MFLAPAWPWTPARRTNPLRSAHPLRSDDDGLQGAAVRHQGHHAGHRLSRSPQTIHRRTFCAGEGLPALGADEPFILTRMNANVALAGLASGRARQIGAEYSRGVMTILLLALRGSVPKGVCLDPRSCYKRASPRFSVELPLLFSSWVFRVMPIHKA